MAREGFVVYHEILKWLDSYGDAERGRLFTAMLKYSMTGEDQSCAEMKDSCGQRLRQR